MFYEYQGHLANFSVDFCMFLYLTRFIIYDKWRNTIFFKKKTQKTIQIQDQLQFDFN